MLTQMLWSMYKHFWNDTILGWRKRITAISTCGIWTRFWAAGAGFCTTVDGAPVWTGRTGALTIERMTRTIQAITFVEKSCKNRQMTPSPNTAAAGLAAGVLKFAELEAAVLFRGELKVKDWGPDDSDVANLCGGQESKLIFTCLSSYI